MGETTDGAWVIAAIFGVVIGAMLMGGIANLIQGQVAQPKIYNGQVSGVFVSPADQTAIINFDRTSAITCNFYNQNSTQVSKLLDVHVNETITIFAIGHSCYVAP